MHISNYTCCVHYACNTQVSEWEPIWHLGVLKVNIPHSTLILHTAQCLREEFSFNKKTWYLTQGYDLGYFFILFQHLWKFNFKINFLLFICLIQFRFRFCDSMKWVLGYKSEIRVLAVWGSSCSAFAVLSHMSEDNRGNKVLECLFRGIILSW